MNIEKKDETTDHITKPKKSDITNMCLIVGVIVVAAVAIGFYIYWLGKSKPSADPSDWADFATYLSGTVGVAAVVATLFAFVKTLGQQQELIDSQDKMLKKQNQQLAHSEKQLIYAKNKDELNRVYEASVNIFPHLVEAIKIRSKAEFPFCVSFIGGNNRTYSTFFNAKDYLGCIANVSVFRTNLELMRENGEVNELYDRDDIIFFIEDFFYEVYLAYGFMFDQLSVDGRLIYLFISNMKQPLNKNIDIFSIMKCAFAFKKGLGDTDFCRKAEDLLHMDDSFKSHESQWFRLGKAVNMIDSEARLSLGS